MYGIGCNAASLLQARLAQLVERKALNLVVVGSSPTVGVAFFFFNFILFKLWYLNMSI